MKTNSLFALCFLLLLLYINLSTARRGGSGKSFSSKKFFSSSKLDSDKKTNTGHRGSGTGHTSHGSSNKPESPTVKPDRNINHNKVLSPRFGGRGGYGVGRGSRYSQSVQGMYPSFRSKGFGRTAMIAASGGAIAGMALGYGLGRFPGPHFSFRSPQEEYYYNHYMYRKYGVKSTDTNDYGRDYRYSQPSKPYHSYMDSCTKRDDLLSEGDQKPTKNPPAVINTNSSAAEPLPAGSPLQPGNQPEANSEDNDTVSIVEIGYPALIEQLKVKRCLELYMDYMEKYMSRTTGGALGLQIRSHGLLAVATSTLMMLYSNMLVLQP